MQEQDEKSQVRQKSIALIFVNKMKTGEFLLDWIHKVGDCSGFDVVELGTRTVWKAKARPSEGEQGGRVA